MSFFRKSGQFTYLLGHSVKTIDPSVILHLNKNMYFFMFYNFVYTQKGRDLNRSPVICQNVVFFRKSGQFTYLSGHSVKTIDCSVILHINKNMYFFMFYNFVYTQKGRDLNRSPVICQNVVFFRKSGQFTYLSGHSVKTIDCSVILHINKNMYFCMFSNFVDIQKCRELNRSPVIRENVFFF